MPTNDLELHACYSNKRGAATGQIGRPTLELVTEPEIPEGTDPVEFIRAFMKISAKDSAKVRSEAAKRSAVKQGIATNISPDDIAVGDILTLPEIDRNPVLVVEAIPVVGAMRIVVKLSKPREEEPPLNLDVPWTAMVTRLGNIHV